MSDILVFLNRHFVAPLWSMSFVAVAVFSLCGNFWQGTANIMLFAFFFLSLLAAYYFWMTFYGIAGYYCLLEALVHAQLSGREFHVYSPHDYLHNNNDLIGIKMSSGGRALPRSIRSPIARAWQSHVNIFCPTSSLSVESLIPFSTFSGGFCSFIFVSDPPKNSISPYAEFILMHELAHTSFQSEVLIQRFDVARRMNYLTCCWILINSNFVLPCALPVIASLLMLILMPPQLWLKLKSDSRLGLEMLADALALQLVSLRCIRFLQMKQGKGRYFRDENLTKAENATRNAWFDKNLEARGRGEPSLLPCTIGALPIGVWIVVICIIFASFFVNCINLFNILIDIVFLAYGYISLLLTRRQTLLLKEEFDAILVGKRGIAC